MQHRKKQERSYAEDGRCAERCCEEERGQKQKYRCFQEPAISKAHENKKKRKKSGQKPVRKATVKKEEQEKQTYTEYTNTGVNRQNVRNTDYTQDISFDTKEEYDYNRLRRR